jgi:type IV pilus assembly protein PilX
MKPNMTAQKHSGFALLPTVVILLVLTVLAMASLRSATLLEKMSGNERDAMLANQAAEAALRDAERDIDNVLANGNPANQNCGNAAACRSIYALPNANHPSPPDFFTEATAYDCSYGICFAPVSNFEPYFATAVWVNPVMSAPTKRAQYGQYTGAANIPGVSQQPVYWIEVLTGNNSAAPGAADKIVFRITARGVGRNAGTVMYLQSVYDPKG